MVKTRGKIPAYNGLDTKCDTCGTGKLSTKNYYYHCGICKYDKCASCSTDCPGHHGLTGFYTPGDGFGCDACGEILAQDSVMFGCRKCNYDLCANCVMNDCPKGCGLTEFQTPHPRYSCDGCWKRTGVKRQLPTGTTMYGCRACNYDLCEDCIFPQQSDCFFVEVFVRIAHFPSFQQREKMSFGVCSCPNSDNFTILALCRLLLLLLVVIVVVQIVEVGLLA